MYSYLDLQQIISPETLVMHLVVGIIRIPTTLILHKGKPTCRVNGRCIVVTSRMPRIGILTVDSQHFWALECRSVQGDHSFSGTNVRCDCKIR